MSVPKQQAATGTKGEAGVKSPAAAPQAAPSTVVSPLALSSIADVANELSEEAREILAEKRRIMAEALARYEEVARQVDQGDGFNPTFGGTLARRSAYEEGAKMGRGAHFAKTFRYFVENGGCARFKNAVAMHIRLNDIRDIDSANGNGSFKVSFFLDTAFWTPFWDREHFDTQATVGRFHKFEPAYAFPEVDVEGGDLSWGLRTAEFGAKARQHETQLGQNYETLCFKPDKSKFTVSVVDPGSHWPRMWRVCINDDEIEAMSKMEKKERKKLEPTNDKPTQCNARMADLFTKLDAQRLVDLSQTPGEGVGFVTYEITCVHRNFYELNEFPFDMHNLRIIVRLDMRDGDAMNRCIVPIAHDKAFFVSSRVSKMVDYHLARNLDWEVTKEPISLGGFQRLNAMCIVRRKPGYFVRNYIVVIFLLTSSNFICFASRPDDFNTRAAIIFTVLLTIVAFKFGGGNNMPTVAYPTVLDGYILLNFYIAMGVGVVNFAFSQQCTMGGIMSGDSSRIMLDVLCSKDPGRWYGITWIPPYSPQVETAVGLLLTFLWLAYNHWYWNAIWKRVQFNLKVVDLAGIGWMGYKYKGPPGMKGKFMGESFITVREGDVPPKSPKAPKPEAPPKAAAPAATGTKSHQAPPPTKPNSRAVGSETKAEDPAETLSPRGASIDRPAPGPDTV